MYIRQVSPRAYFLSRQNDVTALVQGTTGCKTPGTVDFGPTLQRFCLTADAMPPTGSCSYEDLHNSCYCRFSRQIRSRPEG